MRYGSLVFLVVLGCDGAPAEIAGGDPDRNAAAARLIALKAALPEGYAQFRLLHFDGAEGWSCAMDRDRRTVRLSVAADRITITAFRNRDDEDLGGVTLVFDREGEMMSRVSDADDDEDVLGLLAEQVGAAYFSAMSRTPD